MCGIVGCIGVQEALPILMTGLRRLEYRGYDSAGVAVRRAHDVNIVKSSGKISILEKRIAALPESYLDGTIGIGHTRWATHGPPTDLNAHPHQSEDGMIIVVHNGILENHTALRERLKKAGIRFASDESDTEVIAQTIAWIMRGGPNGHAVSFLDAVHDACRLFEGAYALVVMCQDEPDQLIAVKNESPLVIGLSDNETIVASDRNALIGLVESIMDIDDGEIVVLDRGAVPRVLTIEGRNEVSKTIERIEAEVDELSLGDHPHHMLKEIQEQGLTIDMSLRGRLVGGNVHFGGLEDDDEARAMAQFLTHDMKRIVLIACGTSLYAAMIGERMLRKHLGDSVDVIVEEASEFATGHLDLNSRDLVIVLTQSGETMDLIKAVKRVTGERNGPKLPLEKRAKIWSICNVVGSSISRRHSDAGAHLRVGPEQGVASTKAFTAQVVSLALFTLKLMELRNRRNGAHDALIGALKELPEQVKAVLEICEVLDGIVTKIATPSDDVDTRAKWKPLDGKCFLFLGRGFSFPVALEGALKLKEIAYLWAEGWSGGAIKHGPLALVDLNAVTVFIMPDEDEQEGTQAKAIGNLQEVKARGGTTIVIGTEGNEDLEKLSSVGGNGIIDHLILIPPTCVELSPILTVIPLQMLAYLIASRLGRPIDQPRNLAKSVTVE